MITSWKHGTADRRADLMSVLTRDCGISKVAAQALVMHGHVSIDGYTISKRHLRRWTIRQLRGRMLKAGRIECRLYSDGARVEFAQEQMTVDG